MDGFTPAFFLQLVLAIGSAGAVYGAIRADLRNLARSLDEERRIREAENKEHDDSIHDLRDKLSGTNGRVSLIEGRLKG